MAELKMSGGTISALKYGEPIDDSQGRYDFTEWSIFPGQPEDGVEITPLKVTINKFKPNVPIIISNFTGTGDTNTPTTWELAEMSKNTYAKYSGLNANSSVISSYSKRNIETGGNVVLTGLYFGPYNTLRNGEINVVGNINWLVYYTDGTNTSLGNDLTIRGDGYGYGQINRLSDKTSFVKILPDWRGFPENTLSYWQLSLGIYTATNPDEDGFITLSSPIIFEQQVENEAIIDPTTIEGFKAKLGDIGVYDKEKNFDNTLLAYGIANVNNKMPGKSATGDTLQFANCYYHEKGNYGGLLPSPSYYFICDGGNWPSKYQKLRYPFPTDLEEKIEEGFPIKFGFTQYDKDANHQFWADLYEILDRVYIDDAAWANHLFARSNVPSMVLNLHPQKSGTNTGVNPVTLAFVEDCFVYCTNLKDAIIRKVGNTETFNVHEMFMGCTNLTSLTFETIDESGNTVFDNPYDMSDLSGTFEWCGKLTQWPANCKIVNRKTDSHNNACAMLNYAFEGAGFTYVGNYDEDVIVNPFAPQAFNSMPNLTAINLTLDVGLVNHPSAGGQAYLLFGGSTSNNIQKLRLKNVNHENWAFDGITNGRTNLPGSSVPMTCMGNCSNLNQTSVEYLFDNLYDLQSNIGNEIMLYQDFPYFNNNNTPIHWNIENPTGVSKGYVYCSFYKDGGEISLTGVNYSRKLYKIATSNMVAGDKIIFTGKDANGNVTQTVTITSDGQYAIWTTGTSFYMKAERTDQTVQTPIRVDYVQTFDDKVSEVYTANLYCPESWNSGNGRSITSQMIAAANAKGWHVFIRNSSTGTDEELFPAA